MIDRIYQNRGNRAVLETIKGDNLEILDVGCGAGDNASILYMQKHIVDGITHSEPEIEICRTVMRNVYLHDLANGLPENITNMYDYILCSHVIEHLAYPDKLLRDLTKLLKPDGSLIVALPNLMHYKSRVKLLFGEFEYRDTGIWDNTHLRWYTFDSGKKLLERNGYEVYRSWVDGDLPAMTLFKIFPVAARKIIFKGLSKISKGFFGWQLLYLARRPLTDKAVKGDML